MIKNCPRPDLGNVDLVMFRRSQDWLAGLPESEESESLLGLLGHISDQIMTEAEHAEAGRLAAAYQRMHARLVASSDAIALVKRIRRKLQNFAAGYVEDVELATGHAIRAGLNLIEPELRLLEQPAAAKPADGIDFDIEQYRLQQEDFPEPVLLLNNDAHDETRALHRTVRAMHDGECPKCHKLHTSEMMLVTGYRGHRCPSCGFSISAEETAAVLAEFGVFMEKNLAIFEEWRAKRNAEAPVNLADEDMRLLVRIRDMPATYRTNAGIAEHRLALQLQQRGLLRLVHHNTCAYTWELTEDGARAISSIPPHPGAG